MPPKKNELRSIYTKITLRSRTVEMTAPIKQAELADLMRNIIREEHQAELPALRTMIREEVGTAIENIRPQLKAVEDAVTSCKVKLGEVEDAVSKVDERVSDLEVSNNTLQEENVKLRDQVERLEKFSRRFNVRVVGLKNGIEKGNPTAFMTDFFKESFQGMDLPCEPLVEIAHRVGAEKNKGNRTMIARMQRLQVKQAVIQISKQNGAINFQGMKVRIYADETAEENKRRSLFKDIRKKLFDAKIKNGFRQPSQLLVTFNGETTSFTTPEEAQTYYETVIQPVQQGPEPGSLAEAGTGANA